MENYVTPQWCGSLEVHNDPSLCQGILRDVTSPEYCSGCEYCSDFSSRYKYLKQKYGEFCRFIDSIKGTVTDDVLYEMKRQYSLVYFLGIDSTQRLI